MERLTFEGNFCDIAMCKLTPGGSFCEDGSCSQRRVWERLKEYEDAGAVPVVRCRECKHYETCEVGKDFCCLHNFGVVENDFCSYGDRKEGTQMYNDTLKTEACCEAPTPIEPMKAVILELHDVMVKAKEIAEIIDDKLFGPRPFPESTAKDVTCAHDMLIETRTTTKETLEILYAIMQRIEE